MIDCDSPIPEAESATILATLRQSDSLLQNLRYWNTWLRVSTYVVEDARKTALMLDKQVAEARRQ